MTKIFTTVSDAVGATDSKAEDRMAAASERAAQTQSGFEQQALDYLKEVQAPITEAQTGSLGRLGALAQQGVNPYQLQTEQQLLTDIKSSPFYQSIMSPII